jgi:hypothetical protein
MPLSRRRLTLLLPALAAAQTAGSPSKTYRYEDLPVPRERTQPPAAIHNEGTLEVTISGRSAQLTPGSVAYVASNEEHGWRNVGTGRARYFVLALGRSN